MKQLLQQLQEQAKQAYFTFEQICPEWSRRLKSGLSKYVPFIGSDGKEYHIGRHAFCVVGEAWGRDYSYFLGPNSVNCVTCENFSSGKHGFLANGEDVSLAFEKHMNDAHMDVLQSRGLK